MKKRLIAVLGCLAVLALGAAARAQTQTFKESRLSIRHIHFTQDGKRLLAVMFNMPFITGGTQRQELWSWDIASGRLLSQAAVPGQISLFSDVLSPDGSLCAVRTKEQNELRLLNTTTGEIVCRLEKPQAEYLLPLAFTADGQLLIGAQNATEWSRQQKPASSSLVFWDAQTGKRVLPAPLAGPQPALPGDEYLLVQVPLGPYKKELRVLTLNRKAGLVVKEWPVEAERVLQARLSDDGQHLAALLWPKPTASDKGTLMLWNARTGKELHRIVLDASYQALHFSPDSREVTVSAAGFYGDSTPSPHIRTWDTHSAQLLRRIKPREEVKISGHIPYAYATAFSPNGNLLALGITGHGITLWDVGQDRILRSVEGSEKREDGW